jgi:hypothetical protein
MVDLGKRFVVVVGYKMVGLGKGYVVVVVVDYILVGRRVVVVVEYMFGWWYICGCTSGRGRGSFK